MKSNSRIIIHTDGGARGNPGPAAIGVLIEVCTCGKDMCQEKQRVKIAAFGARIGEATNNVAEYSAVVSALAWLKDNAVKWQKDAAGGIYFYLDSLLVVQQLNGVFRVKEPALRELLSSVRILEQEVGVHIWYSSVPRHRNAEADLLVNQALDR